MRGDAIMNIELKKMMIENRIAKLEDRGGNAPIIKKLKRELKRLSQ
jgi:hypothetical protein